MNNIRILSKDIYSKIQAGEIIDDPSSVVKELLDNAIDAKADHISVSIEEGGKTSIVVTDNGIGIAGSDFEFLFKNHATSKIVNAEDLHKLYTLGFRGEALFSIGAISKVMIKSHYSSENTGSCIIYNGGKTLEQRPDPMQKGTIVSVTDLFYNTPVRLKFLKDKKNETDKIKKVILDKTISFPEISFELLSNEKKLLNLVSTDSYKKRLAQIYTDEVINNLLEIPFDLTLKKADSFIQQYGITDIFCLASNRRIYSKYKPQIVTVFNKRNSIDKTFFAKIRGFYTGYLPKGFYPYFFIYITMHPEHIDHNIHPKKLEIAIEKANFFANECIKVISDELHQNSNSTNTFNNSILSNSSSNYNNNPSSFSASSQIHGGLNNKSASDIQLNNKNSSTNFGFNFNDDISLYDKDDPSHFDINNANTSILSTMYNVAQSMQVDNEKSNENIKNNESIGNYLGILFETYLLFSKPAAITLIDMHAADERINYNMFLASKTTKRYRSLLFPSSITIVNSDSVKDKLEKMEQHGFDIFQISEKSLQIANIPDIISENDETEYVSIISEFINSTDSDLNPDFLIKEILERCACRKSIKQGDFLHSQDAIKLATTLFEQENFSTCPHGRPTFFIVLKEDFEKQFFRKK